jgi:hypothetical protein
MRIYALSLIFALLVANGAIAEEASNSPATCSEVQTCGDPNCCAHCGYHGCCEKYCRVVCEMKEVKKTVWVVKCEDFCAPLPRCPLDCGEGCKSCGKEDSRMANCEGGGKSCNPCASLEERNYIPPKCGKVRAKKTLEKKEITCKIPSYKCVVVYACANCGSKCGGYEKEPQMPATPTPAPAPSKTTLAIPLPPVVGTSFTR